MLSDRYVSDRALPDKAIDLIDEASARVRMKLTTTPDDLKELQKEIKKHRTDQDESVNKQDFEAAASVRDKVKKLQDKLAVKEAAWRDKLGETVPEVGEEDIAQIVAAWTGVPVSRLVEEETARLLRMEEEIHKRMVGQDEAIVTVSQAVRRARAGLKDPRRPIGSLFGRPVRPKCPAHPGGSNSAVSSGRHARWLLIHSAISSVRWARTCLNARATRTRRISA